MENSTHNFLKPNSRVLNISQLQFSINPFVSKSTDFTWFPHALVFIDTMGKNKAKNKSPKRNPEGGVLENAIFEGNFLSSFGHLFPLETGQKHMLAQSTFSLHITCLLDAKLWQPS